MVYVIIAVGAASFLVGILVTLFFSAGKPTPHYAAVVPTDEDAARRLKLVEDYINQVLELDLANVCLVPDPTVPTSIQEAVREIVERLQQYRAYAPDLLLDAEEEDENDVENGPLPDLSVDISEEIRDLSGTVKSEPVSAAFASPRFSDGDVVALGDGVHNRALVSFLKSVPVRSGGFEPDAARRLSPGGELVLPGVMSAVSEPGTPHSWRKGPRAASPRPANGPRAHGSGKGDRGSGDSTGNPTTKPGLPASKSKGMDILVAVVGGAVGRLKKTGTKKMRPGLMRPKDATMMSVECRPPAGSEEVNIAEFVARVVAKTEQYEGSVMDIGATAITCGWNTSRLLTLHTQKGLLCAEQLVTVRSSGPRVCVGVSVGRLLVGIVGGEQKRAVVAFGQPLKIAQALSTLCDCVGARVLMCESAHAAAGSVPSRVVDVVELPNQHRPVLVYEQLHSSWTDHAYTLGFGALLALRYDEAIAHFHDQLRNAPLDLQARRLIRLAFYMRSIKDVVPPSGYIRTYVGWEGWENRSMETSLPDDVHQLMEDTALEAQYRDMNRGNSNIISDDVLLRRQISEAKKRRLSGDVCIATTITDQRSQVWYRSDQALGRGAFGEVWLGMSTDGAMVAIKTLRLPKPDTAPAGENAAARRRRSKRTEGQQAGAKAIEELLHEVALMDQLKHNHIVNFLGSSVASGYVYIVMEYCSGGSLNGVLARFGKLPIPSVRRYVRDMLKGLDFLHGKDVVHRDMKPHNVLVHIDGLSKLADFGASAELKNQCGETPGVIGTPFYMAPEACRGAAKKASDVWGLGVVTCELLTGSIPWPEVQADGFNPHAFVYRLANDAACRPTFRADQLASDAASFVTKCWAPSPEDRPTAIELQRELFVIR